MIDTSASGIRALLSSGEGPQVEFKQNSPGSPVIRHYIEHFSRINGGIMLVGVAGQGEIRGLSLEAASQFIFRARRVASTMGKAIKVDFGTVELDGKLLAFLQVFPPGEATAVIQAQALRERSKLKQFAIELFLAIVVITSVWWYSVMVRTIYPLKGVFPGFTPTNIAAVLAGLIAFFALIFYGTSFEVTPFKFLSFPIAPFRLLSKASVSHDDTGSAETPNGSPGETRASKSPADEAVENASEIDEAHSITGIPSKTPELTDATGQPQDDDPAELMNEIAERATFFANKLERKTNSYMILGVGIGAIGLFVWAWKLSTVLPQLTPLVIAQEMLPRITILLFIELLAGFFLRQYRIGIEDFKYFFEIEQRTRWRAVSHAIARKAEDKELLKQIALSLDQSLSPQILKKDESTGSLEAMRVEPNPALEVVKLVADTAKEAIGKIKSKS